MVEIANQMTEEQFTGDLWPNFWKAFPKMHPEQAARLGPIYFERFHEQSYSMLKKAFDGLVVEFIPTYNEPLPSIATISKKLVSLYENKAIAEHDTIKNDSIGPPQRDFYDALAQQGILIGPYKNRSLLEIQKRGRELYKAFLEKEWKQL